jgi:hypothetical protein
MVIYHKFNDDFKSQVNFKGKKKNKRVIGSITQY